MPAVAKIFEGNLEQALNASQDHVYIKNNLRGHSILLIEIKDTNGKAVGIRLPRTWVPIDLMLFTDRESIRKSDSIRKLLRKGAIVLLDPESADKIMKTDEAREEAKRSGILGSMSFGDIETPKEPISVGKDDDDNELNYYKNIVDELLVSGNEDNNVRQIKDMKSSYFADPESVNKDELIAVITDARDKAREKGLNTSAAELDSMIDAINA